MLTGKISKIISIFLIQAHLLYFIGWSIDYESFYERIRNVRNHSEASNYLSLTEAKTALEKEKYLKNLQEVKNYLRMNSVLHNMQIMQANKETNHHIKQLNAQRERNHIQTMQNAASTLSKIASRGEYYILYDNPDGSIKTLWMFDALPR
ncbi:hypothetical protein ACFL1F_00545, partial [Chlamydiota bacterium]